MAFLCLGACDMGPWEPNVGEPQQAFCVDEDSDDSVDVSYSVDIVGTIFDVERGIGCNDCHTPGGETPIGFEVGGLDMSNNTTLRAGGVVSGSRLIVPGSPCDSILFQKVSAGAPFGARMPLDGPPYLEDAKIELLHDWIAEGARDN